MKQLLEHMMKCVHVKAYYPALITAVTIPDICAALESDGHSKSSKYISWFDTNAARYFSTLLIGKDAYSLRCSVLHQGRLSHPKFKGSFDQIIFVTKSNTMSIHLSHLQQKERTFLVLDVDKFCSAIFMATHEWLTKVESTEGYKRNFEHFFKSNVQPLPWHEDGILVIASF